MYPPHDPGADSASNGVRSQAVRAVTLHRTVGSWPGDYSVGKNRHHSSPGTFNFLIGADRDQAVMFYPPEVRCSHAAGANRAGPGIEFSGQNGAPLTDWQIEAGGELIRSLARDYGVPLVLYSGPRIAVDGSDYRGFVNHASVETEPRYRHVDYVTDDEFTRMAGGITPAAEGDEDLPFIIYIIEVGPKHGWLLADGTGYSWLSGESLTLWRTFRDVFGMKMVEIHVDKDKVWAASLVAQAPPS